MPYRVLNMAALVLLHAGSTLAATEVHWWTVDSGGVMWSTDSQPGGFELSGTIGQPDAGAMSGGPFDVTGGFWFRQPQGDCDASGTVSLADYLEMSDCLEGPGGAPQFAECNCFDFDGDDDVDLLDFAEFSMVFGNG